MSTMEEQTYCTTPYSQSLILTHTHTNAHTCVVFIFFSFKQDLSKQLLNTIFLFSVFQPAPCLLAENE